MQQYTYLSGSRVTTTASNFEGPLFKPRLGGWMQGEITSYPFFMQTNSPKLYFNKYFSHSYN